MVAEWADYWRRGGRSFGTLASRSWTHRRAQHGKHTRFQRTPASSWAVSTKVRGGAGSVPVRYPQPVTPAAAPASYTRPSAMTFSRITTRPDVCTGKPCIRDLRFPVSRLLGLLAAGQGREEILRGYPYL